MAGILLTRDRIHEYLKGLGHTPADELLHGSTGVYRYWKTPWGHFFPVPDVDYVCPTWVLEDIVDRANKTRPPIH